MDSSDLRSSAPPQVWVQIEEHGMARADLIMRIWTAKCDSTSMRRFRDHVVYVQLRDDGSTASGAPSYVAGRAATASDATKLMEALLIEIGSALRGHDDGCIQIYDDCGPRLTPLHRAVPPREMRAAT